MKYLFLLSVIVPVLSVAQAVSIEHYDVNTPDISASIDPERKLEALHKDFFYDQAAGLEAVFTTEYYLDGTLQYQRRLELPIDEKYTDMAELELAQVYNFYPKRATVFSVDTLNAITTKSDTIAYTPQQQAGIYSSDLDHLLGELDDPDAVLHYIYFKNEGKIIAKKSINTFITFSYDDANNITQTAVYRAVPHVTEVDEPVTYEFISSPTDYTKTAYDDNRRISAQWTSIDEDMFVDPYFNDPFLYDASHLLEYDEYQYNDKDQITTIKRTYFYLKKDWKSFKNSITSDALAGNLHPAWDQLELIAHSKKTEIYNYEYDDLGRITQRSIQVSSSYNDVNSWVQTTDYLGYNNLISYEKDRTTEAYSYQSLDDLDGTLLEKGFVKIIYYYNDNAALIKKEVYNKNSVDEPYFLESRETLKYN